MKQRLCNQLYGHVEFLERLCIDQNLQSLFLISQQDGSTFLKQATRNFMLEQAERTTQLISDLVKNPNSPLYSIDKTFKDHYSPTDRQNALWDLLRGNDIDNDELKSLLFQESFITEKLLQYYQATSKKDKTTPVRSISEIEKEIQEKYQKKMEEKISTLRITIENTIREEYENKLHQKEVNIQQKFERSYTARRTELEQQYTLKFAELENNRHFSTTLTNPSFSAVPNVTAELRKDIEDTLKPRLMEEARKKTEIELRERITKEIKSKLRSKYNQKYSHTTPINHSTSKSYKEIRKIYSPQIEAEISNAVDAVRESIAATAIDSLSSQAEQNARAKIMQYEVPMMVKEEVQKARKLIEAEKNVELQRRQIAADAAQREAESQLRKAEEIQSELIRKKLSLESEIEELKRNSQSKQNYKESLRREIEESLRSKIENETREKLEPLLKVQIENKLRPQIESEIRSKSEKSMKEELENEIKRDLEIELRPKIESELRCKLAENEARIEYVKQKELEKQIRQQLEAEYSTKYQRAPKDNNFSSQLKMEPLKQREELESQLRVEMENIIADEVKRKEQLLAKKYQLDLIKQRAEAEDDLRTELEDKNRIIEKKLKREIRKELESEMNEKMRNYRKQIRDEYDQNVFHTKEDCPSTQSMKSVASSEVESDLRQLIESELRTNIEREIRTEKNKETESALRAKIEKELRPIIESDVRSELEKEYKYKLKLAKMKLERHIQRHNDDDNHYILDEELKLRKEIEAELKYQFDRASQDPQKYKSLRSEIEKEVRNEFELSHRREKETLENEIRSKIESKLRSRIRIELESTLRSQIKKELEESLRCQIRHELESSFSEQISKEIEAKLRNQIRSELESEFKSKEPEGKIIKEKTIKEIVEEIHYYPQSPFVKRLRKEFEKAEGEEILSLYNLVSEALSAPRTEFTRSEFISRTKCLASDMIKIRQILNITTGSIHGTVSDIFRSNEKLSSHVTQSRALLARQAAAIDKLKESNEAWTTWAKKLYEKMTGKFFSSLDQNELRNAIYSTN